MNKRVLLVGLALLLGLVALGSTPLALAQEASGYVLVHPVSVQPAGGGYVLTHTSPDGLDTTGTPCCCSFLPCARR